MTALGICLMGGLGEEFDCVVPGHVDRATLYTSGRGYWRYRCGEWSAGLAEVRASLAYGRARRVDDADPEARLGRTEVARWSERLDYDAGLVVPRAVDHELPGEVSSTALAVAEGVLLLLALRDERWAGQGFTFSRGFAMAWCGVSEHAARQGIEELRGSGFLAVDGMQGRALLYRLPGEVMA